MAGTHWQQQCSPRRCFGNNEGMEPPATATRWTEVGPSAGWVEAVAVEQEVAKPLGPGVRPLKGFTRHKLRERLSAQRLKGAVMQQPMAEAIEQLSMTSDRAEWEFPPARPAAPGRTAYRRGAKRIREGPLHKSSGGGEGRRKIAKSAVESVKSRLALWRKRKNTRWLPTHRGAPPAHGVSAEKSWLQVRWGVLVRCEEEAHSVGIPLVECFGFGAAGRQTLVRKGHWPSSEVRCARHTEVGSSAVGVDPLCSGGPMFTREGTLCGSWWAMRAVELSTARCMQVEFLKGEGCGRCVFNLPVTKTDPQALGKKRSESMCRSKWPGSCTGVQFIMDQLVLTQFQR